MSKFRFYYEDTDVSRRVYHANYLKFFERGRTELIYQTKYTHEILLKKFDIFFVVKECTVKFNKPAFFEDEIQVATNINELSRVKIKFKQKILRESDLIAEAKKICSVLAEQNSNNSFTVADFKNNSLLGRNQTIELLEYLDKIQLLSKKHDFYECLGTGAHPQLSYRPRRQLAHGFWDLLHAVL